jgi:hypothetical protein
MLFYIWVMMWQDLGNVVDHCPAHDGDDDPHIDNANVVDHGVGHALYDDQDIDQLPKMLLSVLLLL